MLIFKGEKKERGKEREGTTYLSTESERGLVGARLSVSAKGDSVRCRAGDLPRIGGVSL